MSHSTTFILPSLAAANPIHAPSPVRLPQPRRVQRKFVLALALALFTFGSWALARHERMSAAIESAQTIAVPARQPAAPWQATDFRPLVSSPATAVAAVSALSVSLEAGEIRINAQGASRQSAAQQLAALTHAELLYTPDALAQAAPLTVNWRGRDAAEAWRVLLGPNASHALQCDQMSCRVWLVADQRAAAARASTSTSTPMHPVAPAAQAATLPSADVSAPASPATQTMQPDPPGLFPSE